MPSGIVAHTIQAGTTDAAVTTAIDTTGAGLLVVHVASLCGTITVTDSLGNTWMPLTARSRLGSGDNCQSQLFYTVTPTVGAGHTFTASGIGLSPVIGVSAFAGSFTFDTQNGNTGFSGANAGGTITPIAIGELVVVGEHISSAVTVSVDSGCTIIDQLSGAALAYLFVPSTSALNPTWTYAATTAWADTSASFLPTALAAQTITFPTISDRRTGDPSFLLTATSTSGLAVSYSITSGPATVSGSTVTITGPGTVTIEATQAGNGTYAAATPISRTFNVTHAQRGNIAYDQIKAADRTGNGNQLLTWTTTVPATAADAGSPGQISCDGTYLYVCVGGNAWMRAALSTW